MAHTDNMRVNFNIAICENEKIVNPESLVNKPIVVNNIPVGCITDAKLDESGAYYSCLGVIWDRFIRLDYIYTKSLELEVESVNIQ